MQIIVVVVVVSVVVVARELSLVKFMFYTAIVVSRNDIVFLASHKTISRNQYINAYISRIVHVVQ